MKALNFEPSVPKIAMLLLSNLFFEMILTLESEKENMILSKQLQVRKCLKDLQAFINNHPYGVFHIKVLGAEIVDEKKDSPFSKQVLLEVTFKNYQKPIEDVVVMDYHIYIDNTYTTFDAYQSSVSGQILFKVKT